MNITIPDEALLEALLECRRMGWNAHPDMIEVACLAMLKHWPGMVAEKDFPDPDFNSHIIILPLPQENTNAEG